MKPKDHRIKKGIIRETIANINYESLNEADKGFYNEMRQMVRNNFWCPSNKAVARILEIRLNQVEKKLLDLR